MNNFFSSLNNILNKRFAFPLEGRFTLALAAFSNREKQIFFGAMGLLVGTTIVLLLWVNKTFIVPVPTYGGTLVEGVLNTPAHINPLLAGGEIGSEADRDIASLVYSGLLRANSKGNFIPDLAERYEISKDGLSYTFWLKEDLEWHDGKPITADDVVFTIQKAQNPALKSQKYADWSGVSVRAIDQHTVRFTLTKPYAPFLGITTLGILPSRLWQNMSNEEFPFSTLQTNPVGAGPFKVTNVSRDASGLIKSVLFTQNPLYALGRPYLDEIRFDFYSRNEDLVRAISDGTEESSYNIPAKNALTAPYARVFGVFWNQNEKKVFTRLEVRKALSLALDRQDIIDTMLGGYATPIMGPVPPGENVDQASVPLSKTPIADAAAVLQAAGWTYDGTQHAWKHSAAKQTLDRITLRTSNVPELKNVASAAKTQWEMLGIHVDIELYEPGDLSQNVIRPRKYEALLYGMVIGRDQDLYAFWSSQERNDPGLNIALYANKTVDDLLESVRGSADQKKRATDLQKIEDTIAAEYPAAFIYAPSFTYAVPNDLKGVILPQIITPSDRFATVAAWYRATDAVWPFFAK